MYAVNVFYAKMNLFSYLQRTIAFRIFLYFFKLQCICFITSC